MEKEVIGISLTGKSGQKYKFGFFDLLTDLVDNKIVYILSQVMPDNNGVIKQGMVFIGETDDISALKKDVHFKKKHIDGLRNLCIGL